jgi:DNA-binding Lrp family transcriptional regulator
MTATLDDVPVRVDDPINAKILAVSEDRIAGFDRDPIATIARLSGVDVSVVVERIIAMLRAGVIRRVRQTLLANRLAEGALVAWKVPEDRLDAAFDTLFREDPFAGHVVIRSTDAQTPGSGYRLWTTLKVPQGFSVDEHCAWWAHRIGATGFRTMAAKKLFALGVGHVRRRSLEIGGKADVPADPIDAEVVTLDDAQWRILRILKREFEPHEIGPDLWTPRALEAGLSIDAFCEQVRRIESLGLIGRFSTFLEHAKPLSTGERVTRYNALFHWAVPESMQMQAGREVGRFFCMTHAYWREGGPEFANVNVMGVAHGQEKSIVLAHKQAIDEHLRAVGIPVSYTNVFWGGRSEIKPSEIDPKAYGDWCASVGFEPTAR